MDIERVKIVKTLKAGEKVWNAGVIIQKPIPPEIMAEVRANSGVVEVLSGIPLTQAIVAKQDDGLEKKLQDALETIKMLRENETKLRAEIISLTDKLSASEKVRLEEKEVIKPENEVKESQVTENRKLLRRNLNR